MATEPNANAIRDIENMIIYDSLGLSPRRIVHIRHGVEFDDLLHRYRPPHAASVSVAALPRFRAPDLQEHRTAGNRVRIALYVADSKDWRSLGA